ncbi:hypothetical protein HMPREF0762_01649 [Slackia exigua ATCC 700122]|uniref:Uncharacterized protein n=1 Tax=Slackia exigua (strain ATCC 700122 / DSM 15923 / CIP 105133 / JCM 11022 / KCTC 5966 / S-7) TaxID=649764 RepID=D0WIH4_SLAES|nr:hypothetical protein HMPREF0762_01649 [Slackia exigua ATCC 700122]
MLTNYHVERFGGHGVEGMDAGFLKCGARGDEAKYQNARFVQPPSQQRSRLSQLYRISKRSRRKRMRRAQFRTSRTRQWRVRASSGLSEHAHALPPGPR